ncbi:MAG: radical SAM family heme chaperone HemW [Clostridia bacterium]|nr:radical SAM family heme chaperone HemW [Clostridia bacterium]MDD4376055.1 radical SAM family heme chaperone HemW [Clostridia bacterium]
MNDEMGIYVHIPFCKSKCYYCDFYSLKEQNEEVIERYIESVIKELLSYLEILSCSKITTVYFGGGTPSSIDSKYIKQIMDIISLFTYNNLLEATIEVNPADVSENLIKDYIDIGFNRVSIGMQSTNNAVLKSIGRRHSFEDIIKACNTVEKAGINNVSLDVITGLPGDNVETFSKTINDIFTLGDAIKHVSVYSLEVHDNTKLGFLVKEGMYVLPNEDEEREMDKLAKNMLEKEEFNRYEISNYSKKGYESKHNSRYWNQEKYIGIGTAASSYINGKRYKNIDDIEKYIKYINSEKSVVMESEELDKLDIIKEYIILKLRLLDGISKEEYYNKFKEKIYDKYKHEIDKLVELGLLIEDSINIKLTEKGRDLANIVWQEFI